jgi:hypothetical protein
MILILHEIMGTMNPLWVAPGGAGAVRVFVAEACAVQPRAGFGSPPCRILFFQIYSFTPHTGLKHFVYLLESTITFFQLLSPNGI